jgi:hypothetical protein
MTYISIDRAIGSWAARHRLTLFTRMAGTDGMEVRSVYLSSRAGECCQIWIDPPREGIVVVHAADVETLSEHWRREWTSPTDLIDETLESALESATCWLERDGGDGRRG